jgi:hypothetical protein
MHKIMLVMALGLAHPAFALFGTENFALAKIIAGQVQEIAHLAEIVGASKDNIRALEQINSGINRVTNTINTLEEIERRAQGLDPRSARKVADLTRLIQELKRLRDDARGVMAIKIALTDETISQASVQSETAYLMGQEMIKVGGSLSQEAHSASPGRAAQITASANSNTMLSEGVQLQTLAHIAQLQTMSLELQKSQMERELQASNERERLYQERLARPSTPRPLARNP